MNARCEALGVKPPSRSTLWNMAMERRGDHGGAETGIVIATCAVRLPMAVDGGVDLPALTMAVRASDGAVLAAALDAADWQTAAATIAASSGDAGPVRADKALLTWKRAVNLRAGVEPVLGAKVRSTVSRILGSGIEDVRLVYRLDKAIPADRLLRTRQDRPLSPADVRAIVASAVGRHNAARGVRDAAWIDAATSSTGA